jgi:nucleoside-diphosphate-sugar epimerase
MVTRIVLTGATGFVGRALISSLCRHGCEVVAVVREKSQELPIKVRQIELGELTTETDFTSILQSGDLVIHLAGRAHVSHDNDLEAFRRVNTNVSLTLANQAAKSGVVRFVYLSSIGVNGKLTNIPKRNSLAKRKTLNSVDKEYLSGDAFRETDTPNPHNAYSVSKWEAEQGLMKIAQDTRMEVVVIRPPLVYGPGAKGNFASLVRCLKKGVPLPFGAIHNKRSFVGIDNLVSFIELCLKHPHAANETFLISDGEDVSTTELLRRAIHALDTNTSLLPVPVRLMNLVANALGKKKIAEQLFGSLQVDTSKARDMLGWKPCTSMSQQLAKMVNN